jgi:hypothetical protein
MRSGLIAIGSLAITVACAFACSSAKLPAPDYTGHPTSALVAVPYPPPPARVETVPKQPADSAVWIDGEWIWQRRWAWRAGRWVTPPPGARFAPWTTVRDRTGGLYFAEGRWRTADGSEVEEPPPPLGGGRPGTGSLVSPEGDEVPAGPKARDEDAGRPGDRDGSAEATRELDAGAPLSSDGGTLESSPPSSTLDAAGAPP